MAAKGFPLTNFGDLRFLSFPGGVPIVVDGEVVGAVAVSGLPDQADIDLARLGARVITGVARDRAGDPAERRQAMSELRWGILSTAEIGVRKVIGPTQAAARCRVVALASREANRAMFAAQQLGIPRSYGSYEALLRDPEVDAVYNPLPNHLHAEWTIAALEAGKHVLCEKPIGLSAAEARRMDEAARRAAAGADGGLHVPAPSDLGDHPPPGRGGPHRRAARRAVVVLLLRRRSRQDIRNRAETGGGAMYDIGCYCVNSARMLMGGEPTGIQAAVRRDPGLRGGHHGGGGARVRRPPGVVRGVHPGRGGPEGGGVRQRGADQPGDPVQHPRRPAHPGAALPRVRDAPLRAGRGAARSRRPTCTALQAEAFAAAVLDGTPVPVPMSDSIANMEVIERILALG